MVSDGYNEKHSMKEVDAAITNLFETGPTHFVMVGASQGKAQPPDEGTSVMNRWETALKATAARNLQQHPNAKHGFYVTSSLRKLDKAFYKGSFKEED